MFTWTQSGTRLRPSNRELVSEPVPTNPSTGKPQRASALQLLYVLEPSKEMTGHAQEAHDLNCWTKASPFPLILSGLLTTDDGSVNADPLETPRALRPTLLHGPLTLGSLLQEGPSIIHQPGELLILKPIELGQAAQQLCQ